MTRTPTILGSNYDAPAQLPDGMDCYEAKRCYALGELKRAQKDGDTEVARLMKWETGLIDLVIAPAQNVSAYRGADYEKFAAFYGFDSETLAYARERAKETRDVILKLHYLEYCLLQSNGTGREWIELQREILTTQRVYVDAAASAAEPSSQSLVGCDVDRALTAMGQLFARGGVLRDSETAEWAEWLVNLAERSKLFPKNDPNLVDHLRHRWVADYLDRLASLPPAAISTDLRTRSLALLAEAACYYDSHPLNDHFSQHVAEVDANLRKHFGENAAAIHEKMVRVQVAAAERRAEFHEATGNGLVTAHFYREARRLVEKHRGYFTAEDVSRLQRSEQAAIRRGVEGEEFARIEVPVDIPSAQLDFMAASPQATVAVLVKRALDSIPRRSELESQVREMAKDAPLHLMISRAVIGADKVVGESTTEQTNLELDVEHATVFHARILGAAFAITVKNAAARQQLAAAHLMAPLNSLRLEQETTEILRNGFECLVDEEYVAAAHILVAHFEDVFRSHLRSVGVDTTEFKRDKLTETSRTDDATLGWLMRAVVPGHATVRDYLGEDRWHYLDAVLNSQTGLNLRHKFAHGLARLADCSPEVVGMTLGLYYMLAAFASAKAKV